ncbi:MAG: rhodanese-like domain-containing protein [Nitrospiraceae bacterium]|nr:MAG: rhodanese-like domain-containing protein [Nitrospiraceae bacterium]
MKRFCILTLALCISFVLAIPAPYAAADMAKKLNDVLVQAPANMFWQVEAAEVSKWLRAGKTDFLLVDTRPNPAEYAQGHMPGAIQIPVQSILKPENLKKLPKNKKVILYCVTGQTQNLPVIVLRALGYDAYTLAFGMSAWMKGYYGAQLMQGAVAGAKYLVVK